MSITIQQHKELQLQILELQKLALEFSQLGESKISSLLLQAIVRAHRIKVSKPEAVVPAKAEKGKGA